MPSFGPHLQTTPVLRCLLQPLRAPLIILLSWAGRRPRAGGIRLESDEEEEETQPSAANPTPEATRQQEADDEAAKKAALDAMFLAELGLPSAPKPKAKPASPAVASATKKKPKVMEFRMPGMGKSTPGATKPSANPTKKEITKTYDFAGETVK